MFQKVVACLLIYVFFAMKVQGDILSEVVTPDQVSAFRTSLQQVFGGPGQVMDVVSNSAFSAWENRPDLPIPLQVPPSILALRNLAGQLPTPASPASPPAQQPVPPIEKR
ncbi:uncharacterized protein LOC105697761 [Orussus abietinus]|uniref:uncharacterized protein LOC105697761 n=1 Tax=Orussus abietinus TaxID=222816 RepID=UPI000625F8DC|nr:uncharacterized protein LOC105697761 [Orussus abietinus]